MTADEEGAAQSKAGPIPFAVFLETVPPSEERKISDLVRKIPEFTSRFQIQTPELQLHCPRDTCNGTRFFRALQKGSDLSEDGTPRLLYLSYACSNCNKAHKYFSLQAARDLEAQSDRAGICYKIGEIPIYGPPTPSRLISLIGPDREIFLKGRRCENQGLGIGAFGYYRRVVENQKNRILDEIIKVSEKLGAAADVIDELRQAKNETQFSRAVDSIKGSLPGILLINGHNPLTLLHSALSDGLHAQTDERCLEIAHDVRVVLAELSERLGQALKDEAELSAAVSRLLSR